MYKLRLSLPLEVSLVTKETFADKLLADKAVQDLPSGFEVVLSSSVDPSAVPVPLKEKKHATK